MKALASPHRSLRQKAVMRAVKAGSGLDVRPADIRFREVGRRGKSVCSRVEVQTQSGARVTLFEKLARSKAEARFYESCRTLPPGRRRALLPNVHATLICRWMPELLFFSAASYMEVLEPGLPVSETEFGVIAAGVARYGQDGRWLPEAPEPGPDVVARFAEAVRNDPGADAASRAAADAMARRLPALLAGPAWAAIPKLACHNDLHAGNIGCRPGDPARQPVVFDWEAVAMNRAGSDLDRLFPIGGTGAGEAAFDAASRAYREHLSAPSIPDAEAVEVAAGVCALRRRMMRYLRSERPAEVPLREAVLTWERLVRRLDS